MSLKALKIVFICISFTLLTGFFPILSLLGPGLTMVSSGNVVQAGTQIIFNHTIKQKTGKNSLTFFKDEVTKKNSEINLDNEFKELVKRRVTLAHNKLNSINDF